MFSPDLGLRLSKHLPPLPYSDLTTFPPTSPGHHARPQLRPKLKEISMLETGKANSFRTAWKVHWLQAKNGFCIRAQLLCPVTLWPFFIRRTGGGTRGLDRVYIYSWEVSFPLGQCEDMSVWWQITIRGCECMCVWGTGYWVVEQPSLFFPLFPFCRRSLRDLWFYLRCESVKGIPFLCIVADELIESR